MKRPLLFHDTSAASLAERGDAWLKVVREGDLMPEGFGVAWHVPTSFTFVCMPIPFNMLFAWAFAAYHWIRIGYARPDTMSRMYDTGFQTGLAAARYGIEKDISAAERKAYAKGVNDGGRQVVEDMRKFFRAEAEGAAGENPSGKKTH